MSIMLNYVRTLVSENRKRFIDNDVNLDLSYITDRIIAMSYPSEGLECLYRNSITEVKKSLFCLSRFLDRRHAGHYKVYNLRSEKQYTLSKFSKDHQAPPFTILIEFCQDASSWLREDAKNVVAIHCKAGKGRTGTVIAALLLHLGISNTSSEAIRMYGEKRTKDSKGITIPSQVRYVEYYEFMLRLYASN
ncbi:protein-tyrosine phosphatase-like protein [Mycotypha africana]|uniref:protein-tyrosine phosphatase-like protein n=1 Tax=Mycotypha africana TaxID=64632 RepID=UPI002300DE81|nr:protein-tyrosine phosphatase-like protein [Mycotypha africana]KAI8968592.1 protein-tyrosine phosphatase-like protein [Mycotypha africana]